MWPKRKFEYAAARPIRIRIKWLAERSIGPVVLVSGRARKVSHRILFRGCGLQQNQRRIIMAFTVDNVRDCIQVSARSVSW